MTGVNIDEIPVSHNDRRASRDIPWAIQPAEIPWSQPIFFLRNILYPSKTIQKLYCANCLITLASFC